MKSPNCCRFCTSQTCFKDISNEYYHGGHKQVFSAMLLETFNIKISDHRSRLICEECITQLRNAAVFKARVLRAEEDITRELNDQFYNGNLSPKLECDDFVDHITGEFEDSDSYPDDDCRSQSDEIITNIDKGELFVIKLEPAEECNPIIETKMTKRNTRKSFKSKRKLSVSSDNVLDNNDEVYLPENDEVIRKTSRNVKDKKSTQEVPKRKLKTPIPQSQTDMKENSLKLINNSNLCLFDSLKTKFRCFYCKESYLQIKELREHAKTHTNLRYLKMCISRLRGMSFKNVDISSLNCKLCSEQQKDLSNLQNHLIKEHQIEFSSTEHLLIPYRIENGFNCVICSEEFNTFYRLSIHMNSHYTNNVCEICGVSYINRLSLRTHVHSMHREKKCSICPATFLSNYSRVKHMRKSHNSSSSKRYCLQCDKTFPYTYLLIEHRIQEHGAKRQISTCLECGKTFFTPQNLRIHIRSVHIRERNHPCSYCGMRFFTKCDQRRHERTHEDVRSFACSYCEGRFKSKDSLRRHLKRQHGHLFVPNQGITE